MVDHLTIGTVLPYCDAILVDNEARTLLTSPPVQERLGFDTRVYSRSNLEELFEYLNGTEKDASDEHLSLVGQVYGEVHPYTTVFEDSRDSDQSD